MEPLAFARALSTAAFGPNPISNSDSMAVVDILDFVCGWWFVGGLWCWFWVGGVCLGCCGWVVTVVRRRGTRRKTLSRSVLQICLLFSSSPFLGKVTEDKCFGPPKKQKTRACPSAVNIFCTLRQRHGHKSKETKHRQNQNSQQKSLAKT